MTAKRAIPSKVVVGKTYVHVASVELLETDHAARLAIAEQVAGVRRGTDYNVARFEQDGSRVALLSYADFFDDPFPALNTSWLVDPTNGAATRRTYEGSFNPPILHRKELLLAVDHPRRSRYAALTEAAESIGLFEDTTRIGFREQWYQLIAEKGYKVVGHELVPLGNDEGYSSPLTEESQHTSIARHLTALVRNGFSAPVQSLARHGFLDGRNTIFDYGCGRGDDVRGLLENGLTAAGWDPHYAPENEIRSASIVNLGFVINVIENPNERIEALKHAFGLCEQFLVVSVMLTNQNALEGQRYNDGVVTRRGTFQKYYAQVELKAFVEQQLGEEAIAVGPGIFYVFRDKDAEQRFLTERYRSRRNLLRSPSRQYVEHPRLKRDRSDEKFQQYQVQLDALWALWLKLGREPEKSETASLLDLIQGFGTLGKALRFISTRQDLSLVEAARAARTADLEVYFALNQFEKRQPYRHLEAGLQRDIRAFFGDYANARQSARDLLFRIAEPGAINAACAEAAEKGLGWYVDSESLQLHVSMVEQLAPILRVYVGCASVLYGDIHEADLIKIHIRSGKLSLMKYDDFEGKPLPQMMERVKIRLRDQDFDYFKYGEEFEPPFLYNKSRYINEEFPGFARQVAFDEALAKQSFLDLSGYGPPPDTLTKLLENNRWEIDGFELRRSTQFPDILSPCGRYLSFHDLIECGETQNRTKLPNRPTTYASYNALHDLATQVLDPIIDYFGMIRITYGFCSPELSRHIKRRVAPALDQHAAHETKRNGSLICARLGAAVDFIVTDEDMRSVAEWIIAHVPFDRLYFYGRDRPVHISFAESHHRAAFEMVQHANGTITPMPLALT